MPEAPPSDDGPARLDRTLAALERRVDDPVAGLFGPRSLVWRVNREAAVFLGAGTALLLQLAHPAVAQAIADHSPVKERPLERYYRTFRPVFAMVFGSRAQAFDCARRLHRVHRRVAGTMPETLGRLVAGTAYRADDVDTLRWVHVTLWHTALLAHDLLLPPLDAPSRDAYCRESRRFAALFGLDEREVPGSWRELDDAVEQTARDGVLAVGSAGAALARFFVERERGSVGRFVPRWYAALTATLLPREVREAYGLPLVDAEQRAAADALARLRRVYPHLPTRLRHVGPYHEACERLAGRFAPTWRTRLGNRLWLGQPRLPAAPASR